VLRSSKRTRRAAKRGQASSRQIWLRFVVGAPLLLAGLAACATSYRAGAGYGGEPGVAPSAYEHYLRGRLASDRGEHELAIAEMRMASAAAPDEPEPRVAVGEALLVAGRIDAANAEARDVVDVWPADAGAWRLLGRTRAATADVRGAAAAFEQAIKLDDKDEGAWLMLGAAYRQLHDDAAVRATYRRLVGALPQSSEGYFRLGRALGASDPGAGEAELARAVELDPGHIDAQLALAELLHRSGKNAAAELRLRDALARSSDDPSVGERLFHVLLESGERPQAVSLLLRLDGEERPARVRLRLASDLLSLRQAGEALRIARSVLDSDEHDAAAHLLAARALDQLGRRSEAIALCRAIAASAEVGGAVGAPPPEPVRQALALAAELLGRTGSPQEGVALLAPALAAAPGDPTLVAAAAGLDEQLGALADARALLDAALAHAPTDEVLAYARAALEQHAGRPDQAVDVMRRLLEHSGDSVVALNFIGYSYAQRGVELDEAERLLRRAIALHPEDGLVLDSLGWLYFKRGQLDAAEDALERADRLTPFEPEILLHLGELYARRGQRPRARDTFRQGLALDPDRLVRRELEDRVRTLEAKAP
jgi:tetratricopeptide (TPR) repeat protein